MIFLLFSQAEYAAKMEGSKYVIAYRGIKMDLDEEKLSFLK